MGHVTLATPITSHVTLFHTTGSHHKQDVSGGLPVQVQGFGGTDLSLWGMQIDLDQARAELRAAVAGGGTAGAKVFVFVDSAFVSTDQKTLHASA